MIKSRSLTILCLLTVISAHCLGATNTQPNVALEKLIPKEFPDGLILESLNQRDRNADPWRTVSFMPSIDSKEAEEKQVSVIRGFKAMYAYPGSNFFANVKVEKSAPGQFLVDKKIITEQMHSDTEYTQYHLTQYLDGQPDKKQQLMETMLQGKEYHSFECKSYLGYQYCIAAVNDLKLHRGVLSTVVIFVPQLEVSIVAYLLAQKNAHFDSIQEFVILRKQFIQHYIEHLKSLF